MRYHQNQQISQGAWPNEPSISCDVTYAIRPSSYQPSAYQKKKKKKTTLVLAYKAWTPYKIEIRHVGHY